MAEAATQAERKPLWEDRKIPIIIGTGEFGTGKTYFGVTICPGPETIVFDNEGSSEPYEDALGFDRIDLAAELLRKHKARYTAKQRYELWRDKAIEAGKSGKYRVLVTDPFSEIEDGLAEYVRANPGEHDMTQAQMEKSAALFWGAVKRKLKSDLDLLRTMFDVIYLTVHMRNEFSGGRPTGRREPKGKETLEEVATLFLEFQRKVAKTGKNKGQKQSVPSAVILKERVSRTIFDEDGEPVLIPLLPPRLPIATPGAIRKYIRNPPDYNKLKADEKIVEAEMSDEERLEMERVIAADRRATAELELQKSERQARIAEFQASIRENAPQSSDRSAERAEAKAEKAAASAEEAGHEPADPSMLKEIQERGKEVFTNETFREYLTAHGISNPGAMSHDQATDLLQYIHEQVNAKRDAVNREKAEELKKEVAPQSGSARVDHPADEASEDESEEPGSITTARVAAIRELAKEANWNLESQERYLTGKKASTWRNLSQADGGRLITQIRNMLENARGTKALPGN